MRRYILKMKTQTCWRLLKYYGYDSSLRLKESLWDDRSISEKVLKSARSFQLLPEGLLYLRKLYDSYKIESTVAGVKKSILNAASLEKIFMPCPPKDSLPFDW